MLKNYLKIARRTLLRHKVFSLVNLLGLSSGMAACLLILLWVQHERSYDRMHAHADRIFRVYQQQFFANATQYLASTSAPVAPALVREFPEVAEATRLMQWKNVLLGQGERQFYGENVVFADSNVFRVFSFRFLRGNPARALLEPRTLVLTQSTAARYFGNEDPLGRTIRLNNRDDYRVTGVVADPPDNTHLHFGCLASLASWADREWMRNWYISNVYTYARLKPAADAQALDGKLTGLIVKYRGEKDAEQVHLRLQPLTDIHLHSDMAEELEPNGNGTVVSILSVTALVVLLLAGINYVTLTLARYTRRLKEVGMRKTLGAGRREVMAQFMVEAGLTVLLAFGLALLLASLGLPAFNALTGGSLLLGNLLNRQNIALVGLGLAGLSLLTGGYPAWLVARYEPLPMLRGNLKLGVRGAWLRSALVTFQFTASIVLVMAAFTAYHQMSFVLNKNLGFEQDYLLHIRVRDKARWKGRTELLRQQLLKLPQVVQATASVNAVGEELFGSDVRVAEGPKRLGEVRLLKIMMVDYDYFQTLRIPTVAGRTFSRSFASDTTAAFVLNETAVRKLGWRSPEEAIGKQLEYYGGGRTVEPVIGVVRDFHFASLHEEIQPLLLMCWPAQLSSVTVKLKPGDVHATLAALEESWKTLSPGYPFEYTFADESLAQLYHRDQRTTRVLHLLAGLSIWVASLGLFGLVAFAAEQRTREIGIRKVLGASVSSIVFLLSGDFLKRLLAANLIAWPLAWWAVSRWLQDFAYRIELSGWLFGSAAVLVLLVVALTISFQAIRAARANPVNSLRVE